MSKAQPSPSEPPASPTAGALATTGQPKDELAVYMTQAKRYPLLTREEEYDLAILLRDEQDVDAAHRLVTSNLRFVVKIAMEYRSYGTRMLDLVQEGNVGLMHAVRKFDPERGYRLITYAVWWIRAYIQSSLLKGWSMVKLGTTQAQRRLFFKLPSATAALDERLVSEGRDLASVDRVAVLAETLGVREKDITEMQMRGAARDFSLDLTLGDGSDTTHLDLLADASVDTEDTVNAALLRAGLADELAAAMDDLNPREREVIQRRYLDDEPPTLREVGADWGVSRERARQIEVAARGKLKNHLLENSRYLSDLLPNVGLLPAPLGA